jgi:uncharacterized coiled-coil protein SlyX
MSIIEKVKKKVKEETIGDLDEQINELRLKFDLILDELKEMNQTLKRIEKLLKGGKSE